MRRRAYLVGLLEPDDAVCGVRLASLDLFSEPSPTLMGRERVTVVLHAAAAETYGDACGLVLLWLRETHPWLLPLLSERAKAQAGGGA